MSRKHSFWRPETEMSKRYRVSGDTRKIQVFSKLPLDNVYGILGFLGPADSIHYAQSCKAAQTHLDGCLRKCGVEHLSLSEAIIRDAATKLYVKRLIIVSRESIAKVKRLTLDMHTTDAAYDLDNRHKDLLTDLLRQCAPELQTLALTDHRDIAMFLFDNAYLDKTRQYVNEKPRPLPNPVSVIWNLRRLVRLELRVQREDLADVYALEELIAANHATLTDIDLRFVYYDSCKMLPCASLKLCTNLRRLRIERIQDAADLVKLVSVARKMSCEELVLEEIEHDFVFSAEQMRQLHDDLSNLVNVRHLTLLFRDEIYLSEVDDDAVREESQALDAYRTERCEIDEKGKHGGSCHHPVLPKLESLHYFRRTSRFFLLSGIRMPALEELHANLRLHDLGALLQHSTRLETVYVGKAYLNNPNGGSDGGERGEGHEKPNRATDEQHWLSKIAPHTRKLPRLKTWSSPDYDLVRVVLGQPLLGTSLTHLSTRIQSTDLVEMPSLCQDLPVLEYLQLQVWEVKEQIPPLGGDKERKMSVCTLPRLQKLEIWVDWMNGGRMFNTVLDPAQFNFSSWHLFRTPLLHYMSCGPYCLPPLFRFLEKAPDSPICLSVYTWFDIASITKQMTSLLFEFRAALRISKLVYGRTQSIFNFARHDYKWSKMTVDQQELINAFKFAADVASGRAVYPD